MIQKSKAMLNEATMKPYGIISALILDRGDEGHRHVTSVFFDLLCLGSHRCICELFEIFME